MSERDEKAELNKIVTEVSGNFRSELNRIMAEQGTVETGWLCEWNLRNGPEWWALKDAKGEGGYFTKDSTKALRFARKQDAQAYIDEAGWTEIIPTEHEWSDPTPMPEIDDPGGVFLPIPPPNAGESNG